MIALLAPLLGNWRGYLIALALGVSVGTWGAWKVTGWYYKSGEVSAYKEQAQRLKDQQATLNTTLQGQVDEQRTINAGLADDLERLRKRTRRMPEAARVDCAGSNRAELSAEDAGFLVREAARADELRAALNACYAYADLVVR